MSKAKKKAPQEDPVIIRIELPLPMDVAGTLLNIIGMTYPNTVVAQGDGDPAWRSDRRLVLRIDPRDRHKTAKAEAKYHEVKQYASGWIGQLTELDPNSISVSPHEMLVDLWVQLAKQTFDMFPDASNYLETVARDKDTGDRYVFWVARSDKQTPHALRQAAEDRADALQAELDQLKDQT